MRESAGAASTDGHPRAGTLSLPLGKYERGVIREAEISVVNLLNGGADSLPASHAWYGHDRLLARALAEDFDVERAEHGGDSYRDKGDIRLTVQQIREPVLVEAKFSDGKGLGTGANISQNALTNYGVVLDSPSWSEWRRAHDYESQMSSILDQFAPARAGRNIEAKGRIVRDALPLVAAANVWAERLRFAYEDRRGYLNELATHAINEKRLREFTLALFMGAHTATEIEELFARGLPTKPDEVPARYYVYYTNRTDTGLVVRRHTPETVAEVLEVFNYRLAIDSAEWTGRIVGQQGGAQVEMLRFVLHWKNVGIGIKTPCINVFLGSHLVSLLIAR